MCKFKIISIFGFLSLLLALKPTYALGDFDPYEHLRAITVPASSCQLRDPRDGPKVYMSNGAWRFRGSQTGTVHFYCPFPVNKNTLSYKGFSNQITSYRVWYHDPDGQGRDYRVAARLYVRQQSFISIQLMAFGKRFDSNAYDFKHARYQMHEMQIPEYGPLGLNGEYLKYPAIYHFGITMERNNTHSSPGFIGIDFNDRWFSEITDL